MIRVKKSLGQNFLNSERVIKRIADAGEIEKDEIVLEIGPGKGVLTHALLSYGAKVVAVEKDDNLIPLLQIRFEKEIKSGKLTIVHGDILDSHVFHASCSMFHDNYKLISNIPYYITGEILRKFLSGKSQPKMMVLMVQKEVSERIIARDGKESLLSLSVKIYGTTSLVMKVSRGNFFPIPNVDSAVIKIDNIKNSFSNTEEEKRFFDILHAGFAHKRKKLSSNLEKILPKEKISEKFQGLKLSENMRAEDVSLSDWIFLSKI